jgi:hypothetical protein
MTSQAVKKTIFLGDCLDLLGVDVTPHHNVTDAESKRYVINCGFIQALICFSLCKFMKRMLFYLSS